MCLLAMAVIQHHYNVRSCQARHPGVQNRWMHRYHLPGLKFLDSRATTKTEIAEAQRVGKFMKVVTVSQDEMYVHVVCGRVYVPLM